MKCVNMTFCNWIFFLLSTFLVLDVQASALSPSAISPLPQEAVPQVPQQSGQPSPSEPPAASSPGAQQETRDPASLPIQGAQDALQLGAQPAPSAPPQAGQPSTAIPQPARPVQADPQKGLKNLIAMLVGCELDNDCLRSLLNQVIQNDPDPTYQALLAFLQNQKTDPNCRTPEIIAVKKATAACLGELITKSNLSGMNNDMNTCFKNKMETLARQRNIFAQSALLNIARKANDTQSINGWNGMIQAEVGTSQYAAYQKCPSPFEILEQLSVLMGQRPNFNITPNVQSFSPQLPQNPPPASTTPKMPAIR